MAKRMRICLLCHQVGITVEFENGNKLKKHIRTRHHNTKTDVQKRRTQLRMYRRELLLQRMRLFGN